MPKSTIYIFAIVLLVSFCWGVLRAEPSFSEHAKPLVQVWDGGSAVFGAFEAMMFRRHVRQGKTFAVKGCRAVFRTKTQ